MLDIAKSSFTEGRFDRRMMGKQLRKLGITSTGQKISKNLNELDEMGYLDKFETSSRKMYMLNETGATQKFHINGKEVIDSCKNMISKHFPQHLERYEMIYLKDLEFIHPLTGKTIRMDEYEEKVTDGKRRRIVIEEDANITEFHKTEAYGEGVTEEDVTGSEIDEPSPLIIIQETGQEGYSIDKFERKYGETTLEHLKRNGDVILHPEDKTKVIAL